VAVEVVLVLEWGGGGGGGSGGPAGGGRGGCGLFCFRKNIFAESHLGSTFAERA
jgi:hypothetical protein